MRPIIMLLMVVVLSFFLAATSYAEQLVDRGAKVNFFMGKVTVKKGNEKEWKDVRIGMKLGSKDAIRTYVESKADIETPEGTVINIMENTVFELSEVFHNPRTKANTTTLDVKTGSVWANVKKLTNQRSSFVFETPTATAAIRGTEVGVDVSKGKTNVTVKNGKVEVKSKSGGDPIYLYQNQTATVLENKRGVEVQAIKPDSIQKLQNELNLDILSPTEGQEFASTAIPVSGKTAPGAIIKVSGGPDLTAGADGAFSGVLSLPEGSAGDQGVVIAAIWQGKTASRSIKFILKGPQAPKETFVTLTAPTEGSQFTVPVIPVSGQTAPGSELVFGDGQRLLSADGAFLVPYKLTGTAPGSYDIKITATLGTSVKSVSVKVNLIAPPRELTLVINRPSEGEEFTKTTSIPVEGVALPDAKITLGSGASLTADKSGTFRGLYELPKRYGDHELTFAASSGGKSVKSAVKIKLAQDLTGCPVEILEPANNADVDVTFTLKGKVENPDNKAVVLVNGAAAQVSGNAFTAAVATGFQKNQTGTLQLTVTEPKPGALLNRLPVVIRGRVVPPLARVLLDGTKEARVFSDGAFEAEYPMSDETGDYAVEVSAILEAGAEVKKKFDVTVQSDCAGVPSTPVKVTVNVNLGAAHQSGEKKQSVAFRYEKQKYPLVLQVSPPICLGAKIAIDVKTTAVELRANDKIIPLPGAGGTLRGIRYEINNTDLGCFMENEVVFLASDEAAEPPSREQTVSWTCPIQNLEKPELYLTPQTRGLQIRVNDKSFLCDKAEEEVLVTVEATGQGQIAEFEVTQNGGGQFVNFINGAALTYTVKAQDKGKNLVFQTFFKDGYLERPVTLRPINPPSFNYQTLRKILPPGPMGHDFGDIEIPVSFRLEGADDYKLIKRVEFRPSQGENKIYEGGTMPTDLEFDDITLYFNSAKFYGSNTAVSHTITYTIRVIDITGGIKEQPGSYTINGTISGK